ncbi:MAG: rod-binding protein [Myxococcota bacterium]|nr:rod-binding protein [Myxococcota bacterium]
MDVKAQAQFSVSRALQQPRPEVSTGEDSPEAIREAARSFEAMFLQQIMKNMRSTIPKDQLFGGGFGEEVFTGMLDREYTEIAARSNQTGLSEMIAQQLGAPPLGSDLPAAEDPFGEEGDEIPAWANEMIGAPTTPLTPADPPPLAAELSRPFGGRQLALEAYGAAAAPHDGESRRGGSTTR